jgi:hypothetical protein
MLRAWAAPRAAAASRATSATAAPATASVRALAPVCACALARVCLERREKEREGKWDRVHCSRADGRVSEGAGAAGTTKIATVASAVPAGTCSGMARASSNTCTACNNLGASSTALTGATAATCVTGSQSPCCNLPVFYLEFINTTATRYALLEFIVVGASDVRDPCTRPCAPAV